MRTLLFRLDLADDLFSESFLDTLRNLLRERHYSQKIFCSLRSFSCSSSILSTSAVQRFMSTPFVFHLAFLGSTCSNSHFSCKVVSIGSWSDAPIGSLTFQRHLFTYLDPTTVRSGQLLLPSQFLVSVGEPSFSVDKSWSRFTTMYTILEM